jgi:hypothetical protein
MKNRELVKRLKQLEKDSIKLEELPITIEIGEGDEADIYVEENGSKRYLSEEEYAEHCKRFVKSGKRKHIEVEIGEWDE